MTDKRKENMTCEGNNLHEMSNENLFDAMFDHEEKMFELLGDRSTPLELAEIEEIRINQIEGILNKRLPEPLRSTMRDIRMTMRNRLEGEMP